jgi:hypothetical protein
VKEKMGNKYSRLEKTILGMIAVGFIAWSSIFIYSSSFIAIDGNRYFALFDDAMISMRYAWNFAHGLGLVWNPGEYIEGYTNLLMTLVMSLAARIFDKSTAALSIQILGGALLLGNAYVSMLIGDNLMKDKVAPYSSIVRIICFTAALLYYPLAYWSLMGMETGFVALFLSLAVLSSQKFPKTPTKSSAILLGLWMGFAFLTRNDSSIFAILIFIFVFYDLFKLQNLKQVAGTLLWAVCVYALFIFAQIVFRWFYYGELVPNTYILKLSGLPILFRIRDGVRFVIPFLISNLLILAIVIADLVFDFRRTTLLFLSLTLMAIGYQIWIGGDPWNYWRIMAPAMPLLFILFVNALFNLFRAVACSMLFHEYVLRNPIFPRQWAVPLFVIFFALAGVLFSQVRFSREILFLDKPYQVEANRMNVNVSIALRELTSENATIGVFWAGAIPYYAERKAIDFLGKSDKYISHLPADTSGLVAWSGMKSVPGHNKYDLDYSIKALMPTYVQHLAWGKQDLREWGRTTYSVIEYKGLTLFLAKNSADVYWERLGVP